MCNCSELHGDEGHDNNKTANIVKQQVLKNFFVIQIVLFASSL